MGDPSIYNNYSENVRLGFNFADLIFVVCQSTVKTAKIGSLENFRLYGIHALTQLNLPTCLYIHYESQDYKINVDTRYC